MMGFNYVGHYNAARIIFTLVLNIGVLVSSGLCESSISYAGDRLFFLVNIALASVIFDFSEKKIIIPIYIFLLILLVGFDPIQSFVTSYSPIELYAATPPSVYYTKFGLAGITVALCFIYLQYIYAESQNSTLQIYEKVQSNNQELASALEVLRTTQDQLVQSNKELKQFASVVSHDLKAPLRAIGSLADFINIDQRENLDSGGKEKLDLLKNRIVRMDNLINGILNYARVGQEIEKKAEINTVNLIDVVIEMLSPPENIQINIQKDLPKIIGEPTRIQQLFQNIISNSIKFIDKPNGKISIQCHDREKHWEFSIQDNGPGIEVKHHEKVFMIFKTLKSRDKMENTGIGLTIVKKIVEMHNGKVWINSIPGEGTTFHFTLQKVQSTVQSLDNSSYSLNMSSTKQYSA